MTQQIDDGGPAFPNPTWAQGMSTRTWLAGMAMQGILHDKARSTCLKDWLLEQGETDSATINRRIETATATLSVRYADALLAQLHKDEDK